MTPKNKEKKRQAFVKQCQAVADDIGIHVWFTEDTSDHTAFEDDGSLHVVRYGTRAMFDVSNSQNDEPVAQNEKTRKVLTALGIEPSYRTLVEEYDDYDLGPEDPDEYIDLDEEWPEDDVPLL